MAQVQFSELVDLLTRARDEFRRDGYEDAAARVESALAVLHRERFNVSGRPISPDRMLELVALVVSILQLVRNW